MQHQEMKKQLIEQVDLLFQMRNVVRNKIESSREFATMFEQAINEALRTVSTLYLTVQNMPK